MLWAMASLDPRLFDLDQYTLPQSTARSEMLPLDPVCEGITLMADAISFLFKSRGMGNLTLPTTYTCQFHRLLHPFLFLKKIRYFNDIIPLGRGCHLSHSSHQGRGTFALFPPSCPVALFNPPAIAELLSSVLRD